MKVGEREEDIDEIHISHGINMGTIENEVRGMISDEIFNKETDKRIGVKGLEAPEKIFIGKLTDRNSFKYFFRLVVVEVTSIHV